jgi:hypothetical protein
MNHEQFLFSNQFTLKEEFFPFFPVLSMLFLQYKLHKLELFLGENSFFIRLL